MDRKRRETGRTFGHDPPCPSLRRLERSAASVVPPAIVTLSSDRRCTPRGGGLARFALSVRELTPIQDISDESRPYSILGQRFITTLRPFASASAAASS